METILKIAIVLIINFQLSIVNCNAQSPVDSVGSGCTLTFNGANQYVEKLSPSSLPTGNAARTIEAWVKINSYSNTGAIVAYGRPFSMSPLGFIFELQMAASVLYIFTDGINGPNNISITTAQAPVLNKWAHMAFTMNTAGNWNYYLNGILTKSGTFPVTINTPSPVKLRIGQRSDSDGPGAYSSPFNGDIDEVKVWNRVLTQTEIQQNMCKKLTGTETGLVGYWRFDDCGGLTTIDASGNGNNGTLN